MNKNQNWGCIVMKTKYNQPEICIYYVEKQDVIMASQYFSNGDDVIKALSGWTNGGLD